MGMEEEKFCKFDEVMIGFRMVQRDHKLIREKASFHSMEARVHAAAELVRIFEQVHTEGKFFNSVSRNDFEIDPENGEVILKTKDHVSGSALSSMNYLSLQAPEVIAKQAPLSAVTDRYTLAVLLFELFLKVHPLEGKHCNTGSSVTFEREVELYGENPVFIFDPENESNRLQDSICEKVEKVWNSYPDFLRKAFVKSFTEGLKDPAARVSEKEWLHMFGFMQKSLEKRRQRKEETKAE